MSNELAKNMNNAQDTSLTLFNDSGEVYSAGKVTTLIHTNKGLTLRWALPEPFNHTSPFTQAMIHTGHKIWNVLTIKPLDNSAVGTEVEVRI